MKMELIRCLNEQSLRVQFLARVDKHLVRIPTLVGIAAIFQGNEVSN